jgi:hypothetical protein
MSQKVRPSFLAKVGEVGDEVKARLDAFAEGLGDLIKVFAFRRVICDAGLCSVSSELGEEVLKALILIYEKIVVQGACLSLLIGVVKSFRQVLEDT